MALQQVFRSSEVEGAGFDLESIDSPWRELILLALESERYASVEELPSAPELAAKSEEQRRCHHDACLDHSWLNAVRAYGRPGGPVLPDTP